MDVAVQDSRFAITAGNRQVENFVVSCHQIASGSLSELAFGQFDLGFAGSTGSSPAFALRGTLDVGNCIVERTGCIVTDRTVGISIHDSCIGIFGPCSVDNHEVGVLRTFGEFQNAAVFAEGPGIAAKFNTLVNVKCSSFTGNCKSDSDKFCCKTADRVNQFVGSGEVCFVCDGNVQLVIPQCSTVVINISCGISDLSINGQVDCCLKCFTDREVVRILDIDFVCFNRDKCLVRTECCNVACTGNIGEVIAVACAESDIVTAEVQVVQITVRSGVDCNLFSGCIGQCESITFGVDHICDCSGEFNFRTGSDIKQSSKTADITTEHLICISIDYSRGTASDLGIRSIFAFESQSCFAACTNFDGSMDFIQGFSTGECIHCCFIIACKYDCSAVGIECSCGGIGAVNGQCLVICHIDCSAESGDCIIFGVIGHIVHTAAE